MDKSPMANATVAASGAALLVLVWAGWSAVVRNPPPAQDCSVGHLSPGGYELESLA